MKRAKKFFRYDNIGYLFVLLAFIYMMIFVGYPIVDNLILSFHKALMNTLIFTVACLVVQFMIGFVLAVFFSQNFRLSKPIRGLLMMPWMIPITVTALIFKFIFGTDVGILNFILHSLGLIGKNIDWLTSANTAMFAIICANVWIGIPFNMILISTGLTTIPKELYESASIDGANKIQSFFRITLPLLKPTIESVLVLGFIYTFKVFDLVYVMTGGGPVNSTHMLSTYSYKLSFELFKYSKGSAAANVLLVILLIVGLFYIKITDEEEA